MGKRCLFLSPKHVESFCIPTLASLSFVLHLHSAYCLVCELAYSAGLVTFWTWTRPLMRCLEHSFTLAGMLDDVVRISHFGF